jgi:hypothetical protein
MQGESIPRGLCQCGCGSKTRIAPTTSRKYGYRAGDPMRFRPGHYSKLRGPRYDEVEGGYTTPCWKWRGFINEKGYGRQNGKMAHKLEWEASRGKVPTGFELDHMCRNRWCINVAHLRLTTHRQNMQNAGTRTRGTSQYRGVGWDKKARKWRAQAGLDGRKYHLGFFDDEMDAARVAARFRAEHMTHTIEDPALLL